MRRLLFYCAFLFFLSGVVRAADAPEISLTVEASDGAILLTGPQSDVNALDKALDEASLRKKSLKEIRVFLIDHKTETVRLEEFLLSRTTDMSEINTLTLPLRQAELEGLLPPIEGLSVADAMESLKAFGFKSSLKSDFEKIPIELRIQTIYESDGPMVVFEGSEAFDMATIYTYGAKKGAWK